MLAWKVTHVFQGDDNDGVMSPLTPKRCKFLPQNVRGIVPKMTFFSNTVDGRNPAPVDMVNIPLFTRFYTSQVVVGNLWSINSISLVFLVGFHTSTTRPGEDLGFDSRQEDERPRSSQGRVPWPPKKGWREQGIDWDFLNKGFHFRWLGWGVVFGWNSFWDFWFGELLHLLALTATSTGAKQQSPSLSEPRALSPPWLSIPRSICWCQAGSLVVLLGWNERDPEFNEPKSPGGTSGNHEFSARWTMYQQFFFGEFRCKLEMESLWISSEKLKLKKCPLWGSVDRTVILWSLETFMSVPWLLLWEIGFPKDKAIVFFLEFL